jgi:hypothetical protein
LGQEAFGSKGKEAPVEQSPMVSIADVTSLTVRAGAMAASMTEKAGTRTTPPARGEQDNLCIENPRLTLDPQTTEAGRTHAEDDAHRCLYIGTPWKEEVTADRHDVNAF